MCNSLSRNKGVEKRAPSLPTSALGGPAPSMGSGGGGGDLMLGAPRGWNFGARKGSSGPLSSDPWLIPILGPWEGSKTGPARAQALQPEEPLEKTGWPIRHGSTDSELWLFFAPSRRGWGWVAAFPPTVCHRSDPPPSPHASPPAQLLSVGKHRSFLLPHFSRVGEEWRKGQ